MQACRIRRGCLISSMLGPVFKSAAPKNNIAGIGLLFGHICTATIRLLLCFAEEWLPARRMLL
jgi:hypothetical protein